MYSLEYSGLAVKQIKKLDHYLRKRIITTLERCRIRPYAHVKKVAGGPYFAFRVGDYRVIVRIFNNELRILVIKIDHHKRIYKR